LYALGQRHPLRPFCISLGRRKRRARLGVTQTSGRLRRVACCPEPLMRTGQGRLEAAAAPERLALGLDRCMLPPRQILLQCRNLAM
jgi:hypothetical protein